MKIFLHACCGPCSLEPVRLLHEAGHQLTLGFMNSNIHPAAEYARRFDTLLAWAAEEGIPVVEGVYDPDSWEQSVTLCPPEQSAKRVVEGSTWLTGDRKNRCRACYRLRFEEAARYAAENGFEGVGTTLSISPYQFTDVIEEELNRACKIHGITAVFQDFSACYREATNRSRALGMYRQNYCGCHYSKEEAAQERAARKARNAHK